MSPPALSPPSIGQARKIQNEVSKLAAQAAPLAAEPPLGCQVAPPPTADYVYAPPAPGVPVGGYAAPVQMQMAAPASQPVTPMGPAGSAPLPTFSRGLSDDASMAPAASAPMAAAASKELEELRAELAREVRPASCGRTGSQQLLCGKGGAGGRQCAPCPGVSCTSLNLCPPVHAAANQTRAQPCMHTPWLRLLQPLLPLPLLLHRSPQPFLPPSPSLHPRRS